MKFAGLLPAGGREGTRQKQRRGRTAAPALRVRYPQLASLQLDFEFSDRTHFIPSPQVTVFHPPAPAYFSFACPYSDCDGEFDLKQAVDIAVNSHETESRGQLRCTGTRHTRTACTLCLEFSITPHWAAATDQKL